MALTYDHTATITRPGDHSAAALDDYGQPTSSIDATEIYDGAIDWQDKSAYIRRTATGDQKLDDVFDGYFPDGLFPQTIKIDDHISTTIKGQAKTGRVISVDYLEESIEAEFQA